MPFILNEDAALKLLLTGITVSDSGNPARPVGVWFGHPNVKVRQQAYPYITIDLIGISEAFDRTHAGYITLPYTPEGGDENKTYESYIPIPVNLEYQVTTFVREPRHDRQLIASLFAQGRLPFRFGYLPIPEDKTYRRLDMLGFSKRDTTEQDKRLLSNIYSIQVSSEMFRENYMEVAAQVLYPPVIDLNEYPTIPV